MKNLLLALLMATCMFSIQVSITGCEDKTDDNLCNESSDSEAQTYTPSNDYLVKGRILTLGGLGSCADVRITKNGEDVSDALVIINTDTIPYSFGTYQSSSTLSSANRYMLTITHEGNTVATGTARVASDVPTITNLDSGDVHQKDSNLTVEWNALCNITSYQLKVNRSFSGEIYSSDFLNTSTSNYELPGSIFSSGDNTEYTIQLNAINGLYPGDENASDEEPELGYEIEGPKGYFIGLSQTEVKIYVPD